MAKVILQQAHELAGICSAVGVVWRLGEVVCWYMFNNWLSVGENVCICNIHKLIINFTYI